MTANIRKIILAFAIILSLAAVPQVVLASCDAPATSKEAIQCGTNDASGQNGSPAQATTSINNTIANVINILSVVVGVIAVIMIIVAGFRFVTAGGDASKVAGAKNAIIYALVGLILAALAQVLVRFVLRKATTP